MPRCVLGKYIELAYVARMLGVTSVYLRRLCRRGELVCRTMFGEYVIEIDSLRRFMEKNMDRELAEEIMNRIMEVCLQ